MSDLLPLCKLVVIITPCMWLLYVLITFFLFCYTEDNKEHIPELLQNLVDYARSIFPVYTYTCLFVFIFALTIFFAH